MTNTLYYGDNLHVLRRYLGPESVDLIYLDPPFNSSSNYNVLFRSPTGDRSRAQVQAFNDAWTWDDKTELALMEIEERRPDLHAYLMSLTSYLGKDDITAYLVMMGVRLIELHRVLKSTGSLYLHCDPTASHYLKIVMDSIFRRDNFRSEVIWRRSASHNKISKQFGPIHDVILFYSKSKKFTFNPGRTPYVKSYVQKMFRFTDDKGAYRQNELTGSGLRTGDSGKPWHSYDPSSRGRHWAVPASLRPYLPNNGADMSTHDMLDALNKAGEIVFSPDGRPTYKQRMGNGIPYQDIWAYQPGTAGTLHESDEAIDQDVKWLDDDEERLGYETQKPLGLLNRIISTSSDEGDVVLDPFCGCGTAVHAAQALRRKWIGIDITHVAIQIIEDRLKGKFGPKTHEVKGRPTDPDGARDLANRDKYQFQFWSVSMIGGQPRGGTEKKGADGGVDGELFFKSSSRKNGRAVISVKGGKDVNPDKVRELIGTRVTQGADAAVFICVGKISAEMIKAASSDGILETQFGRFSRCQIVSVEGLFEPRPVNLPLILPMSSVAKEARQQAAGKKPKRPTPEQLRRSPPLPPMKIAGGKEKKAHPLLPLDEPVLVSPAPSKRIKRNRGNR